MTEAELICQCKRYNIDAQKELYLRYAPKLRGVCQRYANAGYAAHDLLQDSFIKIFANIKQFKSEGSFEGWMRRIVVNNAISYFRKKNREPKMAEIENVVVEFTDEDNDASVFDMLQDKLSKDDVLAEIAKLPDNLRLVLNLYIFEEFSHKEIAQQLSISIQNSKIRLMRARQLLQNYLLLLLQERSPGCINRLQLHNDLNLQKVE